MKKRKIWQGLVCVSLLIVAVACTEKNKIQTADNVIVASKNQVVIDCNYSFEQAIEGTNAPQQIIEQLELVTVHYYAMDGKVHRGQLLTNKLIANDLRVIFKDMMQYHFPVAKVIPVVRYDWDDEASMNDNNTYSFCYRNADYSKHAYGLAIDINPMQNPNRWKPEFSFRTDKPIGAVYNINVSGTFHPNHPIVLLFAEKGFLWGRYFKRNNDDHHFEKKSY